MASHGLTKLDERGTQKGLDRQENHGQPQQAQSLVVPIRHALGFEGLHQRHIAAE